jgi:hypothetical protein
MCVLLGVARRARTGSDVRLVAAQTGRTYGRRVGALIPVELITRLATEYDIRRAVETGTYLGHGTRVLARHFSRVETIELSPRLARRARLRFALNRGVITHQGDSASCLAPSTEPTLYWLDGHWSGGVTTGIGRECPLLDELRATSPGNPYDVYLIDDAHLFLDRPPPPHDPAQWPTFPEIGSLLAKLRPRHTVAVADDVIVVSPHSRF